MAGIGLAFTLIHGLGGVRKSLWKLKFIIILKIIS